MKDVLISFFLKLEKFLLFPFGNGVSFFIILLLVSSLVELVYSCLNDNLYVAIYLWLHHVVICYFLTIIYSVLPRKIKLLYKFIVILLLSVSTIIDMGCGVIYHSRFCLDYADIMLTTNKNEIFEFFETYFSFTFFVYILLFAVIVFFLIRLLMKIKIELGLNIQRILFLIVFMCNTYILTSNHASHWDIVSLGKIKTFLSVPRVDLHKFEDFPDLSSNLEHKPKNVVLIIGESFSKSHSSLYGYEKNTNPCLDSLKRVGRLNVYSDVITSGLYTIEAFKTFMSTYSPSLQENWYECLTIPTLMKSFNYHTEWISNQSKKGFYDNVVTKYASLCDTMIFSGNQYAGLAKSDKDGILINLTKNRIKENKYRDRCFYIVHLMGSHNDFNLRYPKTYDKFQVDDYTDRISTQREILASYDNSILYNDFVVSELMSLFEDEESIVFYFSDHGLDVFNSRDDYVGHALKGNSQSRKFSEKIPFMLYTSIIYQNSYPNINILIKQSVNHRFCSENLIFTIMDILGVTSYNGELVKEKSILR